MSTPSPSPKILVIRRDNIGDLVCTTPLIVALRQRFPQAWLGAWVNSYNAPVLDGNPDLDQVFVYTKGKHRATLDAELFPVITALANDQVLDSPYRGHGLIGNWKDHRDCHIKADLIRTCARRRPIP